MPNHLSSICPVSGEPLHGATTVVTPRLRRKRLTTAIRAAHSAIDAASVMIDRHRTRARGTPHLAFRFDKASQGIYVTGWSNRLLPLYPTWSGPHKSVYLARKALEGVVTP